MSIEIKTPKQLAALKDPLEMEDGPPTAMLTTARALANYATAMQDACNDAVRGQRDACRQMAMMRQALVAVRRSNWHISEPNFVDKMIAVENRCWDETGIAPPGRSVSMHQYCPSDDERSENWAKWLNAERIKALALVDAALAANEARRGIYVASKVVHAEMWRQARANGLPIIATWIDEAGEGQTADYAELAGRCIREATSAHAVILFCQPGEVLKGALIEVGAALAVGIPVHAVGDCESISRVFRKHPLWSEHLCMSLAIRAAARDAATPDPQQTEPRP
jgi:hypothetical protein